jgi:shikimate kinase
MIGSTTALATIGRANQASNLGVTGALPSNWASRADGGALGPNEGVDLVNVNQLTRITALILVTGSGDLTLRANSEIAVTNTRVSAGTVARYTRLS